jgi:hypothetical protein
MARTSIKPETEALARELRELLGEDPIAMRELAETLLGEPDLVTAIADALRAASADALDERLWGPRPTDADVAAAQRASQAAVAGALTEALTNALSRDEAALRLGISPQAVSKRLAAGALVALTRGRTRWFPAWQFHEDGVLPGLADLIAAYPGTPLALTVWATSPSADFSGATPAQTLTRRGGPARVAAVARALAADSW